MLIKCQNEVQVVNLDMCVTVSIDEDNHVVAYYPFDNGWDYLGTYSTKEKAQKALIWLMDCYNMNQLFSVNPHWDARGLFDEYVADQRLGEFQMPIDEIVGEYLEKEQEEEL